MRIKTILNWLIIGAILLIIYSVAGHGYVKFYFGGKADLIEAASNFNKICSANGSCPTAFEGWNKRGRVSDTLFKDNMVYFPATGEETGDSVKDKAPQSFRLVYGFFMPDHWFEVQGGVGKQISSGWKSR